MTEISIRRPVTTSMLFLATILLGFVSLRKLSVDLLPDLSSPFLSIVTRCPGVAPEEMETQVTMPLESSVNRIPGLKRIVSVSKEDLSFLTMEFAWGTNMDFAMLHIRERLNSVRDSLPEKAGNPRLLLLNPQSRPIMVLAVSGKRSLLDLKEFAEELAKPRLEQVEGIASAEITGGVEREIHIEVDPRLLALYGLTIDQVSQRIDGFNQNLEGGTITKGRFKYALRVLGQFEDVAEIGKIGLQTNQHKSPVKLGDVATIKDSLKEQEGLTRLNGQESVGILLRKESGANTVVVTQLTRDVIKQMNEEYPLIDIRIVFAESGYIESAISSVTQSIIYGAALSFLILIIFLQNIKIPLVIAAAIPVSIMATLNLLYFRGLSLNIMSLGGLALGVGMLVDNSIVVSESIFRQKSLGKKSDEAALVGTEEVGTAVTAATMTTIAVFFPVIYIHGMAGQLFKDQALTVSFALFSSLVVSLTLLPMLTSLKVRPPSRAKREVPEEMDKNDKERTQEAHRINTTSPRRLGQLLYPALSVVFLILDFVTRFILQLLLLLVHVVSAPFRLILNFTCKVFDAFYARLALAHHRFLKWALEHKGTVTLFSLIFLILTIILASRIGRELMPRPEATSFNLYLKTPMSGSFELTGEVVFTLEKWLLEKESVRTVFSQTGLVGGMESLNSDISMNSAQIYVEVKDASHLDGVIEDLRQKLANYPDLACSIVKEQSILSRFLGLTTAEVGLKIRGEDLTVLQKIAQDLAEKLRKIEGLEDLHTTASEGKPEFLVRIRKEALERYAHLTPEEIGNFIVGGIRGRVATQLRDFEKNYAVLVRFKENVRAHIHVLFDQRIRHGETLIPLRDLVTYELIRRPGEIQRENQQRQVLVTANLKGVKVSQVAPQIRRKIEELNLPQGFRVILSGEQEEMRGSLRSLILVLLLAIVLVYMILASQFESLSHPFLILFTLPLGLMGAVWALYLTRQTLNVISVIGMVALAGVVVNNAIVKVDCTNKLRERGMNLREAILEAGRIRLRPILMTTATTVFGLLPMCLGFGRGSELQRPLAISIVGGQTLAAFLTLIIIPIFYEWMEKKKVEAE